VSRAGSREPRFRQGIGRMADAKIAWLRTYPTREVSVHAFDPADYDEENELPEFRSSEPGISYVLYIPLPGRSTPLKWNLSSMTTEELEKTRQFFNHLFDLAEPVCRLRDKVAADAEANGDDSFVRQYRDLPRFVTRERKVRPNSEGLHDGSEGDAQRP
jgi:hypothetical protein